MNINNYYFDIHTHILPGVDDGPSDMEQTIRMLQIAASEQIMTIIATPHFICGKRNPDPEYLLQLKDQVQEHACNINKDLRILLGNEIYYSESVIEDLKQGKALTLAGSSYVLVEFSTGERFKAIYHGIGNLIRHGYMPILAHTERYACLYKRTDLISELVKAGCYIQLNSSTVAGSVFNMKAAFLRGLINKGLAHFIGSDCHNDDVRKPIMKAAVRHLLKSSDIETAERILYENPLKVLENTYI